MIFFGVAGRKSLLKLCYSSGGHQVLLTVFSLYITSLPKIHLLFLRVSGSPGEITSFLSSYEIKIRFCKIEVSGSVTLEGQQEGSADLQGFCKLPQPGENGRPAFAAIHLSSSPAEQSVNLHILR